jgi:hypothetical protein
LEGGWVTRVGPHAQNYCSCEKTGARALDGFLPCLSLAPISTAVLRGTLPGWEPVAGFWAPWGILGGFSQTFFFFFFLITHGLGSLFSV